MKKMEESKDEEAEKLLGMRNNGKPSIPIFFPEESRLKQSH